MYRKVRSCPSNNDTALQKSEKEKAVQKAFLKYLVWSGDFGDFKENRSQWEEGLVRTHLSHICSRLQSDGVVRLVVLLRPGVFSSGILSFRSSHHLHRCFLELLLIKQDANACFRT